MFSEACSLMILFWQFPKQLKTVYSHFRLSVLCASIQSQRLRRLGLQAHSSMCQVSPFPQRGLQVSLLLLRYFFISFWILREPDDAKLFTFILNADHNSYSQIATYCKEQLWFYSVFPPVFSLLLLQTWYFNFFLSFRKGEIWCKYQEKKELKRFSNKQLLLSSLERSHSPSKIPGRYPPVVLKSAARGRQLESFQN